MKTILLISLIIVAVVAAGVFGQRYTCAIDNSQMQFTGQTRVEGAKILYEYKCLQGHTAWAVQ